MRACSYKAHFRWQHYTEGLHPGTEQLDGTEACASVTSAFLQVCARVAATGALSCPSRTCLWDAAA